MREWNETKGIPFTEVIKAVNKMDRASEERVMFLMLMYTGCRITELNMMKRKDIDVDEGKIFWKLGKQQVSWRWEYLPLSYIHELQDYWKAYRVRENKVFGVHNNTLVMYFNKRIRPMLSFKWLEQEPVYGHNLVNKQYKYQLKGLRKNFQTFVFYKYYKKWDDANVALLMTAKRMRHKSERITAVHYIQEFNHLEVEKYAMWNIEQLITKREQQEKLIEFI